MTDSMAANKTQPQGMRHKWFPLLVLAAAAGWWIWRATYAQYHTAFHVLVVLLSFLLISLWFLKYGGATRRTRMTIVSGVTVVWVGFFTIFRPVYNGDMGVYRWRLRFARPADESLEVLKSAGQASDWKTTPHDYPGFLGRGHWAEVKGVELETDWQVHPPQELWRREIGAG
jgi:outer membrane protein assembly factor BamB